jgi:DUF1365 family protein
MDEIKPRILMAKVMHDRLKPKRNKFIYNMFYFCLPLTILDKKSGNFLFGINRFGLFSFFARDHGDKGSQIHQNLYDWVSDILKQAAVSDINMSRVECITLPRVMGYVFNPVSFWLCPLNTGGLGAVICEVNNTFGERHIYVCRQGRGEAITPEMMLHSDKIFHVSPFLKREGQYQFQFKHHEENFSARVDFYDESGDATLLTGLYGHLNEMTSSSLIKCFFLFPLITLKVIFLIHWQALRIFVKSIRYVPKPEQIVQRVSFTHEKTISHPTHLNHKKV